MEIRRLREERIKVRRMDKEETRRSRNGESEGESVEYMNQMSEEIRGRRKGEQRQKQVDRKKNEKEEDGY